MATAFRQGLALDAVLFVGVCGAVLSGLAPSGEIIALIVATGLGKSVLGGFAAALRCRFGIQNQTDPGQA